MFFIHIVFCQRDNDVEKYTEETENIGLAIFARSVKLRESKYLHRAKGDLLLFSRLTHAKGFLDELTYRWEDELLKSLCPWGWVSRAAVYSCHRRCSGHLRHCLHLHLPLQCSFPHGWKKQREPRSENILFLWNSRRENDEFEIVLPYTPYANRFSKEQLCFFL